MRSCTWRVITLTSGNKTYETTCGRRYYEYNKSYDKYCSYCGKKIEISDTGLDVAGVLKESVEAMEAMERKPSLRQRFKQWWFWKVMGHKRFQTTELPRVKAPWPKFPESKE